MERCLALAGFRHLAIGFMIGSLVACSPRFIADSTSTSDIAANPCPGFSGPIPDIRVDSSGDGADSNPGDTFCDDGFGACTLRAAVDEANLMPGTQIIYIRSLPTIVLGSEIDIKQPIQIFGAGILNTIVSGGFASRVFTSTVQETDIELDNFSIINGVAAEGPALQVTGGDIVMHYMRLRGHSSSGEGGAVTVGNNFESLDPTFTMSCSLVQSNATNSGANGGAMGIGARTLTIRDTEFSQNSSDAVGGALFLGPGSGASTHTLTRLLFYQNASVSVGGAIAVATGGPSVTVDLTSSTIHDNTGTGGGAAIYTDNGVNFNSYNNTISSNTGAGGFGDLFVINTGGTFSIANTIVWGNTGPATACSIAGTMVSLGNNIIDDSTACTTVGSDLSTDPGLGALAANSGLTTFTQSIAAGGSADNSGNPTYCPTTDQRYFTRAATCDIGAFERQ